MGVHFSYAFHARHKLNIDELISSIQHKLRIWKWRDLTIIRRIQIVKTFIIPISRSAVAVTTINYTAWSFFLKTKILICCLKQGSSTPNNLMVSLKAIWVPCEFRARPSLSSQGLEYLFFHRKVLQPRVNTWPQHRSCQSDSLFREKRCCNTLKIFSIYCFNFLICIIQKRNSLLNKTFQNEKLH